MIRIGDFSKLSRVSIKTLRFYDELGLLKPVEVDRFSGYRYYDHEQMVRLHRILALRDLGFSLEEIGQLLGDGLSAEQMRGMLKLRQAEARQRVDEETERLRRVEARLNQIQQEEPMSTYDVVLKNVEPVQVASVRDVVPTPPEQGALWRELEGYVALQRVKSAGACFTLYHDDEYKERDLDLEVCEPIAAQMTASKRVKVRTLPAATMACAMHPGPFTTIGEAYDAIAHWIDQNGYQICGPCREIYLHPAHNGSQTDPKTLTEIQFPVERV